MDSPKKPIVKMCGKCRQHGMEVQYKNHQNHCPFIECPCKKCLFVDRYRKRIRETIRRLKLKRLQKETRESDSSLHCATSSSSTAASTMPIIGGSNFPIFLQNSTECFSEEISSHNAFLNLTSSTGNLCEIQSPPALVNLQNTPPQLNNLNLIPTNINVACVSYGKIKMVPVYYCDLSQFSSPCIYLDNDMSATLTSTLSQTDLYSQPVFV